MNSYDCIWVHLGHSYFSKDMTAIGCSGRHVVARHTVEGEGFAGEGWNFLPWSVEECGCEFRQTFILYLFWAAAPTSLFYPEILLPVGSFL